MSAYIVDDVTINRILAGLMSHRTSGVFIRPEGVLAIETHEQAQDLGAAMLMINAASVDERYGDGQAEEFRSLDYGYKPVAPPSDIQLLKSIRCWIYQSCESETCCEDPVFKALEGYSSELSYHIVSNTREYEMAEWG